MEEKRFRVNSGRLKWHWPDKYEIEAHLTISDPDAFRKFLEDFNARNSEKVEAFSKAPLACADDYIRVLVEEYLGA